MSKPLLALGCLPLLLVACRDEQIVTYRVPKEKEVASAPAANPHAAGVPMTPPPAPASGGGMANTPVATAAGAGLAWTVPGHWQSKPASAMRKATFVVTGEGGVTAELAVTAFPGDVGGEAANINRWRNQIQLPPLSEAEAIKSIQRLDANGLRIGVVELANESGGKATRVLGGLVPFEGSTWFFKLTGPDALVAREKAAFLQFMQGVRPAK